MPDAATTTGAALAGAVPTVGDPAAMRELARQLNARADLIGSTASGATAPLDDATFEGNAADRLRGSLSDVRNQVTDAASELRDVARRLSFDASEVERQNRLLQAKAEAEAKAKADAAKLAAAASPQPAPDGSTTTPASTTAPAAPSTPVPVPVPEPLADEELEG